MTKKMKTWAVEVEYTVTETLFIDARSQSTAEAQALTDDAWQNNHQYEDGYEYYPPSDERKVIGSRVV